MKTERFAFCQYCDDIRHETDGKLTLVGLYQGGMQINAPVPITGPSLKILCNIGSHVALPINTLSIRVKLGEQELVSTSIPETALVEMQHQIDKQPHGRRGYMINVILGLPAFTISESTHLDVEIAADGEQLRPNSLGILVNPLTH